MGELLLSCLRDAATVYLVALAIVKVTSCEENTPPVSALAVNRPDIVNTEKGITIARLRGTIDKDCTAVCWLAWLVLWKCDMTVLLISEGNHIACVGYESGTARCLVANGLRALTH